jgi:co-chaperonin GroES (HSP10)
MALKDKVTLYGDRMFVVPNESAESKLKEKGIILADTVNRADLENDFIVVAVSQGIYQANGELRPLPFQVGDRLQISGGGTLHKLHDGTEVIIIGSNNVICKINQ